LINRRRRRRRRCDKTTGARGGARSLGGPGPQPCSRELAPRASLSLPVAGRPRGWLSGWVRVGARAQAHGRREARGYGGAAGELIGAEDNVSRSSVRIGRATGSSRRDRRLSDLPGRPLDPRRQRGPLARSWREGTPGTCREDGGRRMEDGGRSRGARCFSDLTSVGQLPSHRDTISRHYIETLYIYSSFRRA
jgi:hypothetical protein